MVENRKYYTNRPSEFVAITKNAISIENNQFYITLPRIKLQKNSRRIQIINKISIPSEIYYLIDQYLVSTTVDSERNTLFSVNLNPLVNNSKKVDLNYFLMSKLLNDFYENIVFNPL